MEEGDIKGAIRILNSDENLVPPNKDSFNALLALHPRAPFDRRPAPAVAPALQVTPAAIKNAIASFPNSSAGGSDGLRPQHLKDLLLGRTVEDPLLSAITDLINVIFDGRVPTYVRRTLFGGTLLTLAKKGGGIRPIAVGYVWRRLAAKVACNHVPKRGADLLDTIQLGFGISGGVEAAVHAARRFASSLLPGKLLFKIDLKNAFNAVRRDVILKAIASYFPELLLLLFSMSTLCKPTDLQFGQFHLSSEEGAQQGDPIGPLYFCLAIKSLFNYKCCHFTGLFYKCIEEELFYMIRRTYKKAFWKI